MDDYNWRLAADIVRAIHLIGTYGTLAVLALLKGKLFTHTVTVFGRTLRIDVILGHHQRITIEMIDD